MTTNTLKEQAELALQKLLEKTIEAGELIAGEVPLVIQELLMWEFAMSMVMFITGLVILLGGTYGFYRLTKWGMQSSGHTKSYRDTDSSNFDHHLDVITPLIYGAGVPFVLIGGSIMLNLTWLQIWLAPRVFLIEYASNLVR